MAEPTRLCWMLDACSSDLAEMRSIAAEDPLELGRRTAFLEGVKVGCFFFLGSGLSGGLSNHEGL